MAIALFVPFRGETMPHISTAFKLDFIIHLYYSKQRRVNESYFKFTETIGKNAGSLKGARSTIREMFMRFAASQSRSMTAATVLFILAATGAASGQETAPAPALKLELNALQPSEKGCRLTFVVTNNLSSSLEKAAFEIALFNEAQVVDRITLLDFKELPHGKTKVRRFDLGDIDCTKITRVLVNDATACSGDGVDPKACIRQLSPSSKSAVQFGS
ncbi:MAG: hypothetical protein ACREIP_08740 [Alphaproteobacteria bacterium]